MKINHIKISNILGIDELEFSPDGFNAITGKNGQGKTSVLEAIKAATGGGHDATLLRKGSDKGEIVLVLDNGMEITRRVTAARSTTDVKEGGKKLTKPADAIRALTDSLSVNPVEFLTSTKKDRVKVLLESMPISVDAEHLSKISGVKVANQHGLQALALVDAVRQQVFDDRTGTNRAVKEKEATINQLTLAMPDLPEGGVEGSEDELRAQLQAASETREAEEQRITSKLAGFQKTTAEAIQKLRDDAQAQIDAIKAKLDEDVQAERAKLSTIETKANQQRQINVEKFTAAAGPIRETLAVIVGNRDAAAKREQTKAVIAQMQEDLENLVADAKNQTEAITAIDTYKSELLASMPIPGLSVEDGEVYRDGVQFDRLNTAQQVEIAFQIAKLRAGELAVVCLDGLELLDSEHLAELEAQAESSGLQVFVTRVSDEEFSVNTK